MSQDHNQQAPAIASAQAPRNLGDLLLPIPTDLGKTNLVPMLRRTADLIAEFRRKLPGQVAIGELLEIRDGRRQPGGFREFLTKKRYQGNSLNSYDNYLGRQARPLGTPAVVKQTASPSKTVSNIRAADG